MRRQMRQTRQPRQTRRIRQARRTLGPNGRRGTVIAASAVALCLGGGLLVGCGGGPGDGYVAVGAAGSGPERSAGGAEEPSGKVTLVPLDGGAEEDGSGGGAGGRGGSRSPGAPSGDPGGADAADGRTGGPGAQPAGSGPGDSSGDGPAGGASGERTGVPGGPGSGPGATTGTGAKPDRPSKPPKPPGSGSTPSAPSSPKPGGGGGGGGGTTSPPSPAKPTPPPTPAALKLSAPQRAPADKRWCEKVTVEFRNTGGTPARSGTITFATHIIGALGVDWATIRSSQPLPAPIAAGATRSQTYTVCLESWRVPLGMRVETQDVSAVWE
ncbi:hypothetical protein ACIOHH_20930 [Streptomyces microflavus]|uniref:hypothetical protein n=1 Tax=Streptomyces microflavus TaxID=1919 RepID=UPI0038088440